MTVSTQEIPSNFARPWSEYAWLAANVAAISVFVPAPALLLFFASSYAAISLRGIVPARFRRAYLAVAIAGLVALLMLYREEPGGIGALIRLRLLYYLPGGLVALMFLLASSYVAIHLRRFIPARFRTVYVAVAIIGLVALLPAYRSEVAYVGAVIKMHLPQYLPDGLTWDNLLATMGVSYCWLRAVLALLDPAVTPWGYVRYYFFFPTFLSGPIMVPGDFLSQAPGLRSAWVLEGIARILRGALKFVASSFLQLVVPLAVTHHVKEALDTYPWWSLWPSTFLAGVWLYLNFSAFSDVYIGLGRIIGYRVPENFNNPFAACDITDFWRRWHVTLGNWLRITIYNPLARSVTTRIGAQSIWVALVPALVTMVICGLWHGMTFAFLAWGALHGSALGMHQVWRRFARPAIGESRAAAGWYRAVSWLVTHLYITLTWTLFFPIDYPAAGIHVQYLARLFGSHWPT